MDQLNAIGPTASHNDRVTFIINTLIRALQKQPLSEDQTFRLFDKLAQRMQNNHPYLLVIQNVIKKLKQLIHTRLLDNEEESQIKSKTSKNLKELFADLSLKQQTSFDTTNQTQQLPKRVQIAALDELENCQQDLQSIYLQIRRYMTSHIRLDSKVLIFNPSAEELKVMTDIKKDTNYELTVVTTNIQKYNDKSQYNCVDLRHSSRILKNSSLVIVPCAAVLKNGGIIAPSGSLMLALTAKSMLIPVIGMASCHTLTDRYCFQPNALSYNDNPYNYFKKDCDKLYGQTFIVKHYDSIDPKYTDILITDIGEATPNLAYKLFEKHYD